MSAMWLSPQRCLAGIAEAFNASMVLAQTLPLFCNFIFSLTFICVSMFCCLLSFLIVLVILVGREKFKANENSYVSLYS